MQILNHHSIWKHQVINIINKLIVFLFYQLLFYHSSYVDSKSTTKHLKFALLIVISQSVFSTYLLASPFYLYIFHFQYKLSIFLQALYWYFLHVLRNGHNIFWPFSLSSVDQKELRLYTLSYLYLCSCLKILDLYLRLRYLLFLFFGGIKVWNFLITLHLWLALHFLLFDKAFLLLFIFDHMFRHNKSKRLILLKKILIFGLKIRMFKF